MTSNTTMIIAGKRNLSFIHLITYYITIQKQYIIFVENALLRI